MADKKSIWDAAGRAGLVLGCVSIAYLTVTWLIGKFCTEGLALAFGTGCTFILWAVKLFVCIYLMRAFMLKFAAADNEADNSDTFKFGAATAILSALIYSAFYLAYVLFIEPETFNSVVDMLSGNPMMDSNSIAEVERMVPKMPAISFVGNLIWCTLFGTVLSAILSRNIPSSNPFSLKDDN